VAELIGDLQADYALVQSPRRSVGTLMPKVTVREVHTDEFTITSYPVDTGTPASDHYYRNPALIELSLGWSDSDDEGFPGYVQSVYAEMRAQAAQREPFDVSTGKRQYKNMMYGNILVVTDEQSEYALQVTARLQEVIITSTQGGDGAPQSSMSDPASTAPENPAGTQSLQTQSGITGFNAGGPVVTTGTTVGTSGLTAFSSYQGTIGAGS
jgi:hypothetical protein